MVAAFDTLDASKTLRNAGVDERMAEAIVQIVQRTTETPDISHLATRDDLRNEVSFLATKEDLKLYATKDDLKLLATKEELGAVKLDIAALRGEVGRLGPELRAELSERLRAHTFATLAYMTALVGLAVAFLKYTH